MRAARKRSGFVALSPEQVRLTRPWAELVDACRYRTGGFGILAARLLHTQAITLNGVAHVRRPFWRDDAEGVSLLVHEAVHARDQRERGWWRYLAVYMAWRLSHPLMPIREHPLERPAYAMAEEVRRRWRDAGER